MFDYGLALGLFSKKKLKPLIVIQNAFITNMLGWNATTIGTLLLGLPSLHHYAEQLAACFMTHIKHFDSDALAYMVLMFCENNHSEIPDGSTATLFKNSLWCNVDDPAVVPGKTKKL